MALRKRTLEIEGRWDTVANLATGTMQYLGCAGSNRLVNSEQIATVTMGSIMGTSDMWPRLIEFVACPVCGIRVHVKEGRTVQH